MKRKVDRPAVKTSSGKIVKAAKKGDAHKEIPAKGERGFTLSDGKFAGREEAGRVAKAAGQVKRIKRAGGKLHSSDLPARKRRAG
jgi:hypothetical protein